MDQETGGLQHEEEGHQPNGVHPMVGRVVLKENWLNGPDTCPLIGKVVEAILEEDVFRFSVEFEDNGVELLSMAELAVILTESCEMSADHISFYRSIRWKKCKSLYFTISKHLADETFDVNSRTLVGDLFSYRSGCDALTVTSIKSKLRKALALYHVDKRFGAPRWVNYVAEQVSETLKYMARRFELRTDGRDEEPDNADKPLQQNFPAYRSDTFWTRCEWDEEHIPMTQEPETIQPIHQEQGIETPNFQYAELALELPHYHAHEDETDHNLEEQQEDMEDEEATYLERLMEADRDISLVGNNCWECINAFKVEDYCLSTFPTVQTVPIQLITKWAKCIQRIMRKFIEAMDLPESRIRSKAIATAIRWYAGAPQLFFRSTGRNGNRNLRIIESRMDQFLHNNYNQLVTHWSEHRVRAIIKKKPRKIPSKEKAALKLIYNGSLRRGIRILESFGQSTCDIAEVKAQMLRKHPQNISTWEPIMVPDNEDEIAIVLSGIEAIACKMDPLVGVGPRNLKADYISKLYRGKMEDEEAGEAKISFQILGIMYLNGKMPSWARCLLGGGLLTPLNKEEPVPNESPDSRPVKAEDSDTAIWCKSLLGNHIQQVKEIVTPQQLAISVSGGCEMAAITANVKYIESRAMDETRIMVKLDVRNGHNSFGRKAAIEALQQAAFDNTTLVPLLIAFDSLFSVQAPIYYRSNESANGLELLCNSCQGGGQGNSLTGVAFALTINSALKSVEERFGGVEVHAASDDLFIEGPIDSILGADKALEYMIDQLKMVNLEPNMSKLQLLANHRVTIEHWTNIPIHQPFVEVVVEGEMVKAYGMEYVGCPVGEELYIKEWLKDKGVKICRKILNTTTTLSYLNSHVATVAINYSMQSRIDYILGTNLPSLTRELSIKMDDTLIEAYHIALGVNISNANGHVPHQIDPSFNKDRFSLRASYSGSGYRPIVQRTCFVNCWNNIAKQLIDHTIESGEIVGGLWNSCSNFLGANSFNWDTQDHWEVFFNSGNIYGRELRDQIISIQQRVVVLNHTSQSVEPVDSPLMVIPSRFGHNIAKLSKVIGDRTNFLKSLVMNERAAALPRDDHRRMSYFATKQDKFSNILFTCLPTIETVMSNMEYGEAIRCFFGIPSLVVSNCIGAKISNSANMPQQLVDSFGDNLKTVKGSKGDFLRNFHDNIVNTIAHSLKEARIISNGGKGTTCAGIFTHCFNANQTEDDSVRRLQGIIPDITVDDSNSIPCPTNPLVGRKTLVDVKTISCGNVYRQKNMEPNEVVKKREERVNKDYHTKASHLEQTHNLVPQGQTMGPIKKVLNSFGKNGKVIGAVVGHFGECSKGIYHLKDLIASTQAAALCEKIDIPLATAKSLFSKKLTKTWGLLFIRGWCRLLISRFNALVNSVGNWTHEEHNQCRDLNEDTFDIFHHLNPLGPADGNAYWLY
jgi:hypothetical protein